MEKINKEIKENEFRIEMEKIPNNFFSDVKIRLFLVNYIDTFIDFKPSEDIFKEEYSLKNKDFFSRFHCQQLLIEFYST